VACGGKWGFEWTSSRGETGRSLPSLGDQHVAVGLEQDLAR
jgi:hypothetical protein